MGGDTQREAYLYYCFFLQEIAIYKLTVSYIRVDSHERKRKFAASECFIDWSANILVFGTLRTFAPMPQYIYFT